MTKVIQMRQWGSLTIPAKTRKRYKLNDGDPLTVIDLGEGLFISPKRSILPELVGEIEELRQKYKVSLEELILGVSEQRTKKEYLKVADR